MYESEPGSWTSPVSGGVNQLWVGDITYVLRGGVFCYLAASLMDRCSRDIAGWELAETMTDALDVGRVADGDPRRGSRRPSWFITPIAAVNTPSCPLSRAVLGRAEMLQSMSRAANCYDNAFMESCFGTFKTELEMTEYDNYGVARRQIAEYIDYYRNDRKHTLGPRLPHSPSNSRPLRTADFKESACPSNRQQIPQ